MPPRYAYWTILVDEQPTAFRSSMQDELQPTFNRLKEKHPSARMVWFQNGKIWNSRLEAQEAMHMRGERGRAGDFRQRQQDRKAGRGDGFRTRETPSEPRDAQGNLEWKPKGTFVPPEGSGTERSRPEWKPKGTGRAEGPSRRSAQREGGKPKGTFVPPEGSGNERSRPDWKPKGTGRAEGPSRRSAQREGGKPKGKFAGEGRPQWKPKKKFGAEGRAAGFRKRDTPVERRNPEGKLEWKPKGATASRPPREARSDRPEWKPKGTGRAEGPSRRSAQREGGKPKGHGAAKGSSAPEKRKWIPKEEYQKSQGVEARRDKNWRPGGAHKDPRQKYKDAKKAKWGRFKQTIRKRWESKQTRKKKD